MKKITIIFLVVSLLTTTYLFSSCGTNYKNIKGYEAYISDCNNGYEDVPYFGSYSDWHYFDEDARKYYNENKRIWGNFLITDYKDGICINRYYGLSNNITIPETICGKPVVKIDGYLHKENLTYEDYMYELISPFANIDNVTLNIPYTVKYISYTAICEFTGMLEDDVWKKSPRIAKINVASDNPYYSSEKGVLYTKDKKALLFFSHRNEDFDSSVIPESVELFLPLNGISDSGDIYFGKNIKKIDCPLYGDQDLDITSDIENGYVEKANIVVHGYKGTASQDWAKKYKAKFVPIDK